MAWHNAKGGQSSNAAASWSAGRRLSVSPTSLFILTPSWCARRRARSLTAGSGCLRPRLSVSRRRRSSRRHRSAGSAWAAPRHDRLGSQRQAARVEGTFRFDRFRHSRKLRRAQGAGRLNRGGIVHRDRQIMNPECCTSRHRSRGWAVRVAKRRSGPPVLLLPFLR